LGQQKWRCKSFNTSQGLKDNREKYTEKERRMAITLYLEGYGFRHIARILSEMFEKFFRWQTKYDG
jgi:transposase-like protein